MKRVVIVDDSLEFGRMLRDLLQTTHDELKINVVPSGEEALLESSRNIVDLLISDIRLPGITGIDLVPKMRVRYPQIKIILVTGQPNDRYDSQVQALNPDGFFHKPMNMGEFLDLVDVCLFGKPSQGAEAQPPLPEEVVMAAPEVPHAGLSQILTELRQRLGAQLVLMSDDMGHVMAQTGESVLPNFEQDWSSEVMTALNAFVRLNRLAGNSLPEGATMLRSSAFDLLLAPVGTYALLIVLRPGPSALRLALAFEEALSAQKDLSGALNRMGINYQVMPEVPAFTPSETVPTQSRPQTGPLKPQTVGFEIESAPEPEPDLESFAALLQGGSVPNLPNQDLDSFWNSLAEAGEIKPANPDMISYDQARQLGLAPGEEEH